MTENLDSLKKKLEELKQSKLAAARPMSPVTSGDSLVKPMAAASGEPVELKPAAVLSPLPVIANPIVKGLPSTPDSKAPPGLFESIDVKKKTEVPLPVQMIQDMGTRPNEPAPFVRQETAGSTEPTNMVKALEAKQVVSGQTKSAPPIPKTLVEPITVPLPVSPMETIPSPVQIEEPKVIPAYSPDQTRALITRGKTDATPAKPFVENPMSAIPEIANQSPPPSRKPPDSSPRPAAVKKPAEAPVDENPVDALRPIPKKDRVVKEKEIRMPRPTVPRPPELAEPTATKPPEAKTPPVSAEKQAGITGSDEEIEARLREKARPAPAKKLLVPPPAPPYGKSDAAPVVATQAQPTTVTQAPAESKKTESFEEPLVIEEVSSAVKAKIKESIVEPSMPEPIVEAVETEPTGRSARARFTEPESTPAEGKNRRLYMVKKTEREQRWSDEPKENRSGTAKEIKVNAPPELAEQEGFEAMVKDVYTQLKVSSTRQSTPVVPVPPKQVKDVPQPEAPVQPPNAPSEKSDELFKNVPQVKEEKAPDAPAPQPLQAGQTTVAGGRDLFGELAQVASAKPNQEAIQSESKGTRSEQVQFVEMQREKGMGCPNCRAESTRVVFCPYCGSGMCANCSPNIRPEDDFFVYTCPRCGEEINVKKKAV